MTFHSMSSERRPHRKYKYKAFPLIITLTYVAAKTNAQITGEGYVSEDACALAIEAALESGYRWVRTEKDYAVFEK